MENDLLYDNSNNSRAPWKGGVSTYFVAIFQVARNPLKFGMSDSFYVKQCPVFFFHKRGNEASNTLLTVQPPLLPPPPPLPSNGVKHTHAQCFSSQQSKSYNVWRRTQEEGGGLYFSAFLKKEQGHFLTQKESACQLSADSEQLEKSQRNMYLRLPSTEPFNYQKYRQGIIVTKDIKIIQLILIQSWI